MLNPEEIRTRNLFRWFCWETSGSLRQSSPGTHFSGPACCASRVWEWIVRFFFREPSPTTPQQNVAFRVKIFPQTARSLCVCICVSVFWEVLIVAPKSIRRYGHDTKKLLIRFRNCYFSGLVVRSRFRVLGKGRGGCVLAGTWRVVLQTDRPTFFCGRTHLRPARQVPDKIGQLVLKTRESWIIKHFSNVFLYICKIYWKNNNLSNISRQERND